MEFQRKGLAALLLLAMLVPETATSSQPRVVVEKNGDNWVTLSIHPPSDSGRLQAYRVECKALGSSQEAYEFRFSYDGSDEATTVTIPSLSPDTTYRVSVTPVYFDRFEGYATSLTMSTRSYGFNREDVMDSGVSPMMTGVTCFFIGIYVIVSGVMSL